MEKKKSTTKNTKKKTTPKKKVVESEVVKENNNLNKIVLFSILGILLVIFVILGIKELDTSYLAKNKLSISKFENNFTLNGYVNRVDETTKEVIYEDYDVVEVNYNITKAIETDSKTEGYLNLTIEYENSGKTYYTYDKNNNVKNMAFYSFYTLDFFDKNTGEQFIAPLNERHEKIIKYKGKEYAIYFQFIEGVSDQEMEWTGVNNTYFTRGVSQKYIVKFEYPKDYNGLIMGAIGASSNYLNDMALSKKISTKENVYIMDTFNKTSKLYDIKQIIKSVNK